MKLPTARFAVLALLSFAASIAVIVGELSSESEQVLPPSPLKTDRQALVEVVFLRTTAKYQIARNVIAGQLSLVQAAALFGALNQVPPQTASWHFRFPGATDEERLCRQVLEYVHWELDKAPDRGDAILARFEADLNQELRTGAIRLPDLLTLVPVEKLLAQARVELIDQGIFPLRGERSAGTASGRRGGD